MSYSLSFSEDFFTGNDKIPLGDDDIINCYAYSSHPKSVLQALVSMAKNDADNFYLMVKEVLGVEINDNMHIADCIFMDLLEQIRSYDECKNINTPVNVCINNNWEISVWE